MLTVDKIGEAMPGKTNPMAIHTAIGHLVRRDYIERFDVPGEQLRGTRLLNPDLKGAQLELPEADLLEEASRQAKLKAVIQMSYAKECRQSGRFVTSVKKWMQTVVDATYAQSRARSLDR